MSWPRSTDYIEAVQNLHWCLSDEELRAGQPALNNQGLPMLWSGNFADVYKIECPSTGNTWALKCFTRQVAGRRERYRQIAAYLQQARFPFTVDFEYLESGIRVGRQWFPAVKMQWVEGLGLNQFVENYADRPKTLGQLLALWPKMAQRLREAGVAHADLQHGNVLLVPMRRGQLALKLIDYDGMYVPGLADRPSGELGHPAYQHPQRFREGTYSAEVDRFSHLAIYCAIRCLKVGSRGLWQRFNNGDNLLFREADYRSPATSEVFQTLWELCDFEANALVGRLLLACRQPLEEVPWLDELVAGERVRPLTANEASAIGRLLAAGRTAVWPVVGGPLPAGVVSEPAAAGSAATPPSLPGTGTPPPLPGAVESRPAMAGASPAPAAWAAAEPLRRRFLRFLTIAALMAGAAVGGMFYERWRAKPSEELTAARVAEEGSSRQDRQQFEAVLSNGLDLGGGVKMEFVRIPAGSFTMGDANSFYHDEKPVHRVNIANPFWMGKYEVTQEQWLIVLGLSPSTFTGAKNPVENVSWYDCQDFLTKLNGKFSRTGVRFRLPTEAEWEYACRAGSTSRYCLGDDEGRLGDYAWFDGNSGNRTHPVGLKRPNAWGLYDMHGNVWEWCGDWYDGVYYVQSPANDPTGPSSGSCRVLRGGSWINIASICRSAYRTDDATTYRHNYHGFRVVCVR